MQARAQNSISTGAPVPPPQDQRPIALLTFANDRFGDQAGYLRNLIREQREVERALESADGRLRVVARSNVRLDDLFDLFARYNDRIAIFHYGGHAQADALLFEDDQGRPAEARIRGVAERLGQLPSLALVFLNGCTTAPHVRQIQQHCRVPIIATDVAIKDRVACDFAYRFYDDLSHDRSVIDSYSSAESRIRAELDGPDQARGVDEPSRAAVADGQLRPTAPMRQVLTEGMRMLRRVAKVETGWPWPLHLAPGNRAALHW
ncbi:MAG: hypothetical protein KC620_06115, partial [Myxococcales bacterium]|nr:hypothetical protein [Myxococcales bacterium]